MTQEQVPAGAVEPADDDVADQLRQVRWLAHLFDESIRLPGGYRVGLDPLMGVVPVVGDLSASAVSVYIVVEAVHLGVPRETVARMLGNVVVDTVVGGVPVVGDVFDAVFKANAKNARLLAERVEDPGSATADRWMLWVVGAVTALVLAATSVLVGAGVLWLASQAGTV